MGCFVYTIFGTSKDVTLGPTAIMSLLVASKATSIHQADSINVRNAIALTLLSGLVQLIMGVCNLGELLISYNNDSCTIELISINFVASCVCTIRVHALHLLSPSVAQYDAKCNQTCEILQSTHKRQIK